jgi:DeoR/GlpR family transcriptional regulator of sugar metabolism
MWLSIQMLATKFNCSTDTIRRRVAEMEQSERFPFAVRRVKGVEVDDEQFERFCCTRRRRA